MNKLGLLPTANGRTLSVFLQLTQLLSLANLAARCRRERTSPGPDLFLEPPNCCLRPQALLSQLCRVPRGWQGPGSCFGWRMPGWAAGEDERGDRPAENWGGSPYTTDLYGHQRPSGKSSVSSGNMRPREHENRWAVYLTPHRELTSQRWG